MKHLWPSIRAKLNMVIPGDINLDIYGAYPTKEDMELSDPSNCFHVKGPIPERYLHSKIAQYKLLLAPLRFGAVCSLLVVEGLIY